MPSNYTKGKLSANAAVVKHRSKKEQKELASNNMRRTGGEATKKQMKDMFDRVKKTEADKRKQMANRVK